MNYKNVISMAHAQGKIVFIDELVPAIKTPRQYIYCDQSKEIVKRNF
jgi:hypothetical protein